MGCPPLPTVCPCFWQLQQGRSRAPAQLLKPMHVRQGVGVMVGQASARGGPVIYRVGLQVEVCAAHRAVAATMAVVAVSACRHSQWSRQAALQLRHQQLRCKHAQGEWQLLLEQAGCHTRVGMEGPPWLAVVVNNLRACRALLTEVAQAVVARRRSEVGGGSIKVMCVWHRPWRQWKRGVQGVSSHPSPHAPTPWHSSKYPLQAQ